MKLAFLFCMFFCCVKTEERLLDKRYIAALAKNNRLPKFSNVQKKNEESDYEPFMEKTRFFLNHIVRPENIFDESFPEDFLESPQLLNLNFVSDKNIGKRNVAALARLGRLNTIRYGRFQPLYVSGKRVINHDNNKEDNQEITNNELDENDIDCEPYEDNKVLFDNIADEVNGRQKKRYVAALARSGRLPIWHSQRMESSKRHYTYPLHNSNSRIDIENNLDNFLDEVPSYTKKQKICKMINRRKRDVDRINKVPVDPSEFRNQEKKRNLAALARNGKLPSKSLRSDKGDENENKNNMPKKFLEQKRNIASLARNGKLFNSRVDGKRNLASLARNGKLFNSRIDGKRNLASLARSGKLPKFSYEGKRNMAMVARNEKFIGDKNLSVKRTVPSIAKHGKPSYFEENKGKRNGNENEEKWNLARKGKSFESDKRNIQALARNNKLPAFTKDYMELVDKRNFAAKNGKSFSYINDLAPLTKNGKLASFHNFYDKRNSVALTRNGFESADKRNLAALARNGKLPIFDSGEDKRMTKSGTYLPRYSFDEKRNIAILDPSLYSSKKKRNIAKNGVSFNSPEEKRNIAALARNGKLPIFNSIEEKREIVRTSGIHDEETADHFMPFNQGEKRHFGKEW